MDSQKFTERFKNRTQKLGKQGLLLTNSRLIPVNSKSQRDIPKQKMHFHFSDRVVSLTPEQRLIQRQRRLTPNFNYMAKTGLKVSTDYNMPGIRKYNPNHILRKFPSNILKLNLKFLSKNFK